jgi:hypothetical protein
MLPVRTFTWVLRSAVVPFRMSPEICMPSCTELGVAAARTEPPGRPLMHC